ncbi:hypothetical protein Tco_0557258 [Tanacetum coccineum]
MGMYISRQNSYDFTAVTISGEFEEQRTNKGIIQNYYDREDGETTPRIECASGPGFGDWQWMLSTLPFAFGGLLLRHSNIVTSGPAFDNALSAFNGKMKIDLLSNPCEGGSDLWVGIDYEQQDLMDIYGDHDVSCIGIVGIKHRHNIVRDTLVDIFFRSEISAGKEVDIGLGGGRDKSLRPADMLLYSWGGGFDVCMDLTSSSPVTQTGMIDFAPGRAVTDVAQRKRVKYEAKCA